MPQLTRRAQKATPLLDAVDLSVKAMDYPITLSSTTLTLSTPPRPSPYYSAGRTGSAPFEYICALPGSLMSRGLVASCIPPVPIVADQALSNKLRMMNACYSPNHFGTSRHDAIHFLGTHKPITSAPPCSYYYVKSYAEGSGIVRLPAGIV